MAHFFRFLRTNIGKTATVTMFAAAIAATMGFSSMALGGELDLAPDNFAYGDTNAVFVDLQSSTASVEFDVSSKEYRGTSRLEFISEQAGKPLFDFAGKIESVVLNGQQLDADQVKKIFDPDNRSSLRLIDAYLDAGRHSVEFSFTASSSNFKFLSDAVRAGFFMSDLSGAVVGDGRNFIEEYLPSTFEYDHYQQDLEVKIVGASKSHVLMVNGKSTVLGKNHWSISFPAYYGPSSFYLHLFEDGHFKVEEFAYQGLEKKIPLTVYANSDSLVKQGMNGSKKVLADLEKTFGAYLHDYAIVYVTKVYDGGMEHAGATITGIWALEHEFTHFWFARGVMPAGGNSGWIDEAIASWRDDGFRAAAVPSARRSVNLGGYSQYRRDTEYQAYEKGEAYLRELHTQFKVQYGVSGLKKVLAELFAEKKGQSISSENFKEFLEERAEFDIEESFDRYVYGKKSVGEVVEETQLSGFGQGPRLTDHPVPFTSDQLRNLL